MNSQREQFEIKFPPPKYIFWSEEKQEYIKIKNNAWERDPFNNYWEGWQAATESQEVEPVAWW